MVSTQEKALVSWPFSWGDTLLQYSYICFKWLEKRNKSSQKMKDISIFPQLLRLRFAIDAGIFLKQIFLPNGGEIKNADLTMEPPFFTFFFAMITTTLRKISPKKHHNQLRYVAVEVLGTSPPQPARKPGENKMFFPSKAGNLKGFVPTANPGWP